MQYGDTYGSLYGGPAAFVDDHGQAAWDRFPDHDRTPGLEIVERVLGERWQAIDYAIQQCMPYLLLDFERISGVFLDRLGDFFGVPRVARDDAPYRRVLAAYALVVYPQRRTVDGMIRALIALLGDVSAVHYEPAYPKGFVVELDGLNASAQLTWDALRILNLSTPATYNRQIIVNPENPLLGDDATGTVVIVSPLVCDDAGAVTPIAGAGELAWVY